MISHPFDPGYPDEPFRSLVADYPGEDVYPSTAFRTEWGPVFHRGRLDGSARVLIIGQDPATHEAITRRILVGEAGQRVQGFLHRLGITSSYVYVNTFIYSVYGQRGGEQNITAKSITDYRNGWLAGIAETSNLEAVISLGRLADLAYQQSPLAGDDGHVYAAMRHPTYPESASASGTITKAEAMARLCENWNAALDKLSGHIREDTPATPTPYGTTIVEGDLAPIPEGDLPPGLPPWMRSLESWARRTGDSPDVKRATITVTVPTFARP